MDLADCSDANTGFDRESVCFQYYDYACQILEGTLVNESWFAFVCHLDPCATCHAKGQRQPSDDCADCDDWKVEGPHWLKANPNLGVSIPWPRQASRIVEPVGTVTSVPSIFSVTGARASAGGGVGGTEQRAGGVSRISVSGWAPAGSPKRGAS